MTRRGAALAAIAVAGVVACGGGPEAKAVPAAAAATSHAADRFRGTPVLPGATAADFALRDENGAALRLSAQHGRFVLLTFLYTDCPDVCPLIADHLNAALSALTPKQRRSVSVVAVSVDPVHDTVRAVRAFVASHRLLPQFHYLIGSRADLKPIWQAYNLLVETPTVERVSHSAYVLLIDRGGRPRLYYARTVAAADVLHDLRRLLRARPLRSSGNGA